MINSNNKCVGCGACQSQCKIKCISMNRINGQYLPTINTEKCVGCDKCDEVCVALNSYKLQFNKTIGAYYGYTENRNDRLSSSSGGIFYTIAKAFIDDGGIVVGAAFDEAFNVKHIIVDRQENLVKIQGSKYVESELCSVFPKVEELLKNGKKVLFSGVPCQIGAIKMFLKKSYDNLYTCEVFCHGAPRSGIFDSYIKWISKKNGKINGFNFRSKKYGWNNPTYEINTENGTIYQKHTNNIYHLLFGKHVSLRDSCYDCQFRQDKRVADISLGDFWGIEKYYPGEQTKNGISAIIVNTSKGEELLRSAPVYLRKCKLNEIYDKNAWMVKQYEKPVEQDKVINDFISLKTNDFFRKYEFQYKYKDRFMRIIERFIK